MHTQPPKLLQSAGRDNTLPRVYNFTSLRFQVGVVNRRLGDGGRYSALTMSRLFFCFIVFQMLLLSGCQRHHVGDASELSGIGPPGKTQVKSPIERAIAGKDLVADSIAAGDPASKAVSLVNKHLGMPSRLALMHTVDGRQVIREPVASHSLPVENCIFIAYQTNGKIDRLEIAKSIPPSDQRHPKDTHKIEPVDSYTFRGIKIDVTIRIGDSIQEARKIIKQNRMANRVIGENTFRIKGDTVKFSVADSLITDISINSQRTETITLEYIASKG